MLSCVLSMHLTHPQGRTVTQHQTHCRQCNQLTPLRAVLQLPPGTRGKLQQLQSSDSGQTLCSTLHPMAITAAVLTTRLSLRLVF